MHRDCACEDGEDLGVSMQLLLRSFVSLFRRHREMLSASPDSGPVLTCRSWSTPNGDASDRLPSGAVNEGLHCVTCENPSLCRPADPSQSPSISERIMPNYNVAEGTRRNGWV